MKKYIFVIICTVSVVLWVAFIFANSTDNAAESSSKSSEVQEIINDIAQSAGIDEQISEYAVRKTAHFAEYMLLGILISLDAFCIALLAREKRLLHFIFKALPAIPLSFAVALIDEFAIQAESAGRVPSFGDVLIDISGASFGALLICTILFTTYFLRKRRRENNDAV